MTSSPLPVYTVTFSLGGHNAETEKQGEQKKEGERKERWRGGGGEGGGGGEKVMTASCMRAQ